MKNIIKTGIIASITLSTLISFNLFAQKVNLTTGEYAPYSSKALPNYGFFPEILNIVFKKINIEPNYQFFPWKRCENEVEAGKSWAAFPYGKSVEREKKFLFSDIIFNSKSSFFYYKKKPIDNWDKLSDLKSMTIGGILGYWYEEDFKKNGLKIDYTTKEISAIKKLMKGRVQLIVIDDLAIWALIKKNFPNEIGNFGTLAKPYSVSGNFLMVSKKYPKTKELLSKFNAALKELKNGAEIKAILDKYNVK